MSLLSTDASDGGGSTGAMKKLKEASAAKLGQQAPRADVTIVGVGIDLDTGSMWWRVDGGEIVEAYTGGEGLADGVLPVVCKHSPYAKDSRVDVNLGRRPFIFAPPSDYKALEDPRCVPSAV